MSDAEQYLLLRPAARQARRRTRRRLLRPARSCRRRSTRRRRSPPRNSPRTPMRCSPSSTTAGSATRCVAARRTRTCSQATTSPTATRSRAATACGRSARPSRSTRRRTRGSTSCCRAPARSTSAARPGATVTSVPAARPWPCSRTCCRCCAPARPHLSTLPAGEGLELEAVTDEPWWAFNYYLGDLRSRVVLNVDVPTTGPRPGAPRRARGLPRPPHRACRSRSSC